MDSAGLPLFLFAMTVYLIVAEHSALPKRFGNCHAIYTRMNR